MYIVHDKYTHTLKKKHTHIAEPKQRTNKRKPT